MRADALLTMPPFPAAYRDREAIGRFLRTVPAAGHLDQITLIPARANMQPAVAAYARDDDGTGSTAYGIMVLTVDGGQITERCISAARVLGSDQFRCRNVTIFYGWLPPDRRLCPVRGWWSGAD